MRKTIFFLIISVISLFASPLKAENRVLSNLSNDADILSVFVGKELISMFDLSELLGNIDAAKLEFAKHINSVEVYSATNSSAIKKLQSAVSQVVAELNLDTFTQISSGDDQLEMYCGGNADAINLVILRASASSSSSVIIMSGDFTLEMLASLSPTN